MGDVGQAKSEWTCACGEVHDEIFDACWNCGAERGRGTGAPRERRPSILKRAFCLGCKYPLRHLKSSRCPECGRAFDPRDPETYGSHGLFEHRRYQVLRHPEGVRHVAVKIGFSWPAFLFGPLWAFSSELWVTGLVLSACWFAARAIGTPFVLPIAMLAAGVLGNELRGLALRRRGWERLKTTAARSAREAMEGTLDGAAVAASRGLGAKVRRIVVAMVVLSAVSIATEVVWWYVTGDGDSIVQQGIEFRARRAIADLGGSFWQVRGRTLRISFDSSEANDEDLRWVRHLPDLEAVELTGCSRVTDAGLAHLEGVAALNYLSIRGTGIRGEGLARLAHLPISNVDLDAEQLDDAMFAGVDSLLAGNYRIFLGGGGMRVEGTTQGTVVELQLRETMVTDGALEIIGRRGLRVTRLDLFATRVTDAGLAHLHALLDLQWVDLMDTNVTLAGVLDLQAARPGLRIHVRNGSIQWNDESSLRLTGAFVDDEGLAHLARMETLPPKLILDRCGVTDEAVAELRGTRPDLEITGSSVHCSSVDTRERVHVALDREGGGRTGLRYAQALTGPRFIRVGETEIRAPPGRTA